MTIKYKPLEIETKWQKNWEEKQAFHVQEDPERTKYYLLEMFPYPRGGSIWVTSAIIQSVTLLRGTNACKDSTSSIPWDGMPSGYRRRMPRSPMASTRRCGRTTISSLCVISSNGWDLATIGSERSLLVSLSITVGSNCSFCGCMSVVLRINERPLSIGVPIVRQCSPMNR